MSDIVAVVKVPTPASVAVPEVGTLSSKEQKAYDALLRDGHTWQAKGRDAMIRFGGVLRDIKASDLVTKRHGDGGWAALVEREFGLSLTHANSVITFTKVQDALLNAPEITGVPVIASVSAAEAVAPVLFPESKAGAGGGRGEATPESTAAAVEIITGAAEAHPEGKVTAQGVRDAKAGATPKSAPKPKPVPVFDFPKAMADAARAHVTGCTVTTNRKGGRPKESPCDGWPHPLPAMWTFSVSEDGGCTFYFDRMDEKGWTRIAHQWNGGVIKA